MKVFAFSCRGFDELPLFRKYADEFGMEFGMTPDPPTPENASLARGSDFVSVLTTKITPCIIDTFAECGVKMICTRTIGYDHIDVAYAKSKGIAVSHITYDTDGVAEYTVMMMLMALRHYKEMEIRNSRNDFTLSGLIGKELKECTVGIVGAGSIGRCVMKILSGFGCRIIYSNRSKSENADKYAERVSFDELLAHSDVVSLHLEHNEQTHHIMDASSFSKMKKGAVFINTARGPLADTEALISALKEGKISVASIDVMENEFGYYYNDCFSVSTEGHFMDRLRELPNAIVMHHMGFYYDAAVRDMIVNSFKAFEAFGSGKEIPFRL